MTQDEIADAVSELDGWLCDAMGDMAMSIMDWPEAQDDWGPRIKKAKANGVTDIHGWLADEMYNDVPSIQDLLGDRIHDKGKTIEDRIEIAETLKLRAHDALAQACENLIHSWREQIVERRQRGSTG